MARRGLLPRTSLGAQFAHSAQGCLLQPDQEAATPVQSGLCGCNTLRSNLVAGMRAECGGGGGGKATKETACPFAFRFNPHRAFKAPPRATLEHTTSGSQAF